MACVRPGVEDTRAIFFLLSKRLIALDFPTFERPTKAISGCPLDGGAVGKEPIKSIFLMTRGAVMD